MVRRATHSFLLSPVAVLALVAAPTTAEVLYSLDDPSPSRASVSNSDVLEHSAEGVPVVGTSAGSLGLRGEALDEIDALSTGGSASGIFHFSVDRLSLRASPMEGGDESHGAPALPLDDVDALALEQAGPLFFSLASGNFLAFGGADVLAPGPSVAIPAAALGLTFLDDIDALHVDGQNGDVYFSLTPSSPSLSTLAAGPADVLLVRGGVGSAVVFARADALGLSADDNLDALAFAPDGKPGGTLTLAGACAAGSGGSHARAGGVSNLVFVVSPAEGTGASLDPACGRDLGLRPPDLLACAGARIPGSLRAGIPCP